MRTPYIKFNMPKEAYNLLKGKKITMEQEVKRITGKQKTIPMTKLVTTILKKPIWFDNKEVVDMTKRKPSRGIKI